MASGRASEFWARTPRRGDEISLRDGRFGAYVQQGEGEKPKAGLVAQNIDPGGITLTQAIGLLSLPREIARHPETKEPILAGIGRFGPYVQQSKTYASIGKDRRHSEHRRKSRDRSHMSPRKSG